MKAVADFTDIFKSIDEDKETIVSKMSKIGMDAVKQAKAEGDYHDRTGHLRASNKSESNENGVVLFNDASYAEDMEARGYNVISSAALTMAERIRTEL